MLLTFDGKAMVLTFVPGLQSHTWRWLGTKEYSQRIQWGYKYIQRLHRTTAELYFFPWHQESSPRARATGRNKLTVHNWPTVQLLQSYERMRQSKFTRCTQKNVHDWPHCDLIGHVHIPDIWTTGVYQYYQTFPLLWRVWYPRLLLEPCSLYSTVSK